MYNKRSKGVTILGVYFVVTSIVCFIISLYFLIKMPQQPLRVYYGIFKQDPRILLRLIYIFSLISGIVTFFIGINILRLREKWRKITLYYCVLMVFCMTGLFLLTKNPTKAILSVDAFPILFFGMIFYFLVHHNVREQFRKEHIKKGGLLT